MPLSQAFHEVRFPTDIALGAAGGPERRTEIITLGSGHEQRNARWAGSRRRYNAGYGVKTLDDLAEVIAFFEERRGRLYGFRFKDPVDYKSCLPGAEISAVDQQIGTGDGSRTIFQLMKGYGQGDGRWQRVIRKPVDGTLRLSVEGVMQSEGLNYTVNYTTGEVRFEPGHVPDEGKDIYAGFEFDVPVRFDTDEIQVNMTNFIAGEIATIPLVEVLA